MEKKLTMMTYITEETSVLTSILSQYPKNIPSIEGNQWLILATGSSYNAAISAKYYIESISDIFITVEEPFKFQYYEKLRPETSVVIGVSQSGESTSTIEAIKAITLERPSISTLAMTSKPNSEITEIVNQVVDIEIGEEKVGYVTKGFSATILKLMLTGLKYSSENGYLTEQDVQKELDQLKKGIDAIPAIIEKTETFFETWKHELVKANRYTSLTCGSALGTALEMQTKFNETVRIPSQGLDIEVFMHGPYLEVNRANQLFFIETGSPVNDRLVRLRDYESKYVDNYFTITLDQVEDERTISLDLAIDEFKAPLFVIVPFQILAHHIAEERGNNLAQRIYTDFGVAMQSKTKPGDYV